MAQKSDNTKIQLSNIEPFSMLMDVVQNLWAVLLGSLAVAMIVIMVMNSRTMISYSSQATFAVMSKRTTGYAYNNLSAARTVATSFTSILNSEVMKKKVCDDVGLESFDATATARVIDETNLLTLTVTSNSPQKTFKIINSIMKLYPDLLQYASTTMVMEVLAQPQIPTRRVSGSSATGMAKRAFVLSFVALTAAFAYLSYRHDTIKSEKDLREKLDATSLGAIEYERLRKAKGDLRKNSVLVSDATASFSFVERYKKIAAALLQSAQRHNAKVIMVSSVAEHEGKSTVAANLALSIQSQGKKVLLVDCDLRRPSQAKIFNIDVAEGTSLTDFLERKEKKKGQNYIYHDPVSDLPLLLNAKGNKDSTEYLKGNVFKRLIDQLKSSVDIVILDTPPMSLMADAEAVADTADISVLVVQYNRILAANINDAIDQLKKYRCHMSGCILNSVRSMPGISRNIVGGYGYGKYSRYGKYGHYGNYGKYGSYGHYAERKSPTASAIKNAETESLKQDVRNDE